MTFPWRSPTLVIVLVAVALGGVSCSSLPEQTNRRPPGQAAARNEPARNLDYAIGADLSFLQQAEDRGVIFKDGGTPKPGLQIFRDHGYNWIRLRLFHSPDRLPNNLDYTIAAAKQAKALGFKFLLDFHYSDTWADPQKQIIPKAWQGLTHAELVRAVFDYTRDTIAAFRGAGAMPDMVQNGNEITPGMLWPDGRLPQHWDHFVELLQAGIAGVDAGRGDAPRPLILVQIEKPGDTKVTGDFFDQLIARGVEFDVIGQSYYPWWHGSLLELRDGLAFMAERYRKPIILVEVAYNWRPAEYTRAAPPYPESPEGQREFLEEVQRAVLATPHGLGRGVFWWEPAVPPSPLRSRGMFDDEGNALPVLQVFDKYTRGKRADDARVQFPAVGGALAVPRCATSARLPRAYFTFPAAFSSTTFDSTVVSDVTGRCEQKPTPT